MGIGNHVRGATVIAALLGMANAVWAGRPLVVDDADPVDKGGFEFEAGFADERDSGSTHWEVPFGLTYGLVRDVELGVAFGGQFDRRREIVGTEHEEGIADLEMAAKWRFLKSCPLGARHAVAAGVKFPTADDDRDLGSGETDYDLAWIASRSIGAGAGVHLNLGYSWIGGLDPDAVHGGLALDYQLSKALQWVGEVFAENETGRSADPVATLNTGIRWNPKDTLTIDMAAGTKICGDAPDIMMTAGLTWAFRTDG